MASNAYGQKRSKTVVDSAIYTAVEVSPQIPGGEKALGKFLQRNIHIPENSSDILTGTIVIQWVVEKDGSVSKIGFVKGEASYQKTEVVKMTHSMPKWSPGRQNGKPVRVKYTVPIHINVGDN